MRCFATYGACKHAPYQPTRVGCVLARTFPEAEGRAC